MAPSAVPTAHLTPHNVEIVYGTHGGGDLAWTTAARQAAAQTNPRAGLVTRRLRAARRIAGILSVSSGLALIALPRAMARIYGLPLRASLSRIVGARDVAIGLGLLGCRPSLARWWWLGRTAADTLDVALMTRAARASGESRHPRGKTIVGAILVGIEAAMTLAALRRSA